MTRRWLDPCVYCGGRGLLRPCTHPDGHRWPKRSSAQLAQLFKS